MNNSQETIPGAMHKMVKELLAKFCDECGTNYQPDDIKIIQRDNNAILTHLSCKNCGRTHLATIIKPLGVSNRIPIKTDLQPQEINKFAGSPSISSDDILDIYEWGKGRKMKNEVFIKNLMKL